nr:hypothetical protein [Tanacetum cinerariifolium]
MRIEESLNVTFDESLPKSSPSVEDGKINEPIVQDLNGSPSSQVNFSFEGYPKSLKEARGHPIEQVIGKLNVRTLSNESEFDANAHHNDEEVNNDNVVISQSHNEEGRKHEYALLINEEMKLMLAVTTNMSRVIKNIIKKQESKDNLKEYDSLKICDNGTKNTFEGNAFDPWIPALKQGGSMILGEHVQWKAKPRKAYDREMQATTKAKRNNVHGSIQAMFLALGWHLEEIHVTWAHLEKKRTRLLM